MLHTKFLREFWKLLSEKRVSSKILLAISEKETIQLKYVKNIMNKNFS